MQPRHWWLSVLVLLVIGGCSSDSADGDSGRRCPPGQVYDSIASSCVTVSGPRPDGRTPASDGASSDSETSPADDERDGEAYPDAGSGDVEGGNGDPDSESETDGEPDDPCDRDGDGVRSVDCGGNDCDDTDPSRYPGNEEQCDAIDHNCNGGPTDGIQCTFYAHTARSLFAVDPFAETVQRVEGGLPNLLDIDTHPDGRLLGIRPDALYVFDEQQQHWNRIVSLSRQVGQANGLAINPAGEIFVTSEDKVIKIDASTGEVRDLGRTGDFYSSGDCVVDKSGTIWMTSRNRSGSDQLVLIDNETGQGEAVGDIGFSDVYGLTVAWGNLFGMTVRGTIIRIDPETGSGTRVFTTQHRWYGAASTPNR